MSAYRDHRRLLLGQHRHLRPLLIALDKEASAVLWGQNDAEAPELQTLRETIGLVQKELEQHFVAEEPVFELALARMVDSGPHRLDRMRNAHAHDRKLLAALGADPPRLAPHAMARIAATFASEVLDQMVEEEGDLAAAGILEERV